MTDIQKLKALAEAATQGRNFDRLPEAGGGLKYECTGDDGSLVLKVDHKNDEWGFVGERGEQDEAFFLACTPAAVLDLIEQIERLERKNANQMESIREYQDLVMGGDVSLGMLKADLRVTTGERDELKAENKRLKTEAECAVAKQNHAEMIGDGFYHASEKLKAENEALRKDAERYRWLRNNADAADWEFLGYQAPDVVDQNIDCALVPSDKDVSHD